MLPAMNLMLFERQEAATVLAAGDPRARHVRDVLRMRVGGRFDVGVVAGPRGKAAIEEDGPAGMCLRFEWGGMPAPCLPLTVIAGLGRPQTMRKILRECSPLGIAALHLAGCDKGEPGYASSTLWTDGEWRTQLLQGAEQAFSTHVPEVVRHPTLDAALAACSPAQLRLALDNYEAVTPLHTAQRGATKGPVILAIGPERGWSGRERDVMRAAGYTLAHMGPRVLRAETAFIAACSVAAAALGGWDAMRD